MSVADLYKGKSELVYTALASEIYGSGVSRKQGMAAYLAMNSSESRTYQEAITKMNKEATKATVRASQMNIGSFAASRGYDAINAEGHGGTGSYTVVLNRTKVILDKDPWEVN